MSIKQHLTKAFIGTMGGLRTEHVLIILLVSCLLGAFIFWVYKWQTKTEFYSRDFNITLPALAVITAAIMVAIQTNILVSLGMVGALSIVRFRTAVKNPMDLGYLFWAIGVGIICGVRLHLLALILSLIVASIFTLMRKLGEPKALALLDVRSALVVCPTSIEKTIRENSDYCKVSSLSMRNMERESIYEVRTSQETELIQQLLKIDGVKSVNYLEHHGERRF